LTWKFAARRYGLKNRIDGHQPTKDDKISVVDDVFTTGKTLRTILKVLKEDSDGEVIGFYSVVRRSFTKFEYPYKYVLLSEDLGAAI